MTVGNAVNSSGNGHFQSHYIPNTLDEQAGMLASLGLRSIDELFNDIPAEFRNPALDLPAPLSELEIQRELGALAARNRPLGSGPSFLGAGCYHHFIPAIVKALITRGEFLTAYTPYQAEASQGLCKSSTSSRRWSATCSAWRWPTPGCTTARPAWPRRRSWPAG